MFDTVILNANIVYPSRNISYGNIGIRKGKIKAITGINIKIQGLNCIDASNKYVFPGVIETHSHIGIGAGAMDLSTETSSASIGGVTTVLFFLRKNTHSNFILYENIKVKGYPEIIMIRDKIVSEKGDIIGEMG